MAQSKPPRSNIKPPVKKRKKITDSYLHNAGLYYLQRFAASTGQFRTVMRRKIRLSCKDHPEQDEAACREMLEALIEKFIGAKLLDDDVYVAGAVRSLRSRGKSKKAITAKLESKGIAAHKTHEFLQSLEDENETEIDSETKAALTFARSKKLGPFAKKPLIDLSEEDRRKQLQKAMMKFSAAGFSYALAQKILMMVDEDDNIK